MCSIVGLLSRRGDDVGPRLLSMLDQTRHRGPDGAGVALGLAVRHADDVADLTLGELSGSRAIGHSRLKITGESGIQPLAGCGRGLLLAFNGELWNHASLRRELEARGHAFDTDSDSEVLIHRLEEEMGETRDLARAAERAVRSLDGEYAFAAYDDRRREFVLARDVVGVKQLYYGQSGDVLAFCSEKKPLWDLGIKPRRVLPGEVVKLAADGSDGWRFETAGRFELPRPAPKDELADERQALVNYWSALVDAVRKRIDGHRRVGVIFSGGVDSVLIARIAQRLGVEVRCYSSGLPGSSDLAESRFAADELCLPLAASELDPQGIESELPSILSAIESANHLQVDVAIPIYFAVKRAARDGIRVLLTGQGADELFAGYPWYPKILADAGEDGLRDSLWNDLSNLYKDTLEREDKITMFHSIELRVPFLDPRVIDTALRMAPELKIRDGELKVIHRRLAEESGVPHSIAWRPKEAAQHGSNVHETLKGVLARLGDDMKGGSSVAPAAPDDATEELGSAYRYGGDAYAGNDSFQSVLDRLGQRVELR